MSGNSIDLAVRCRNHLRDEQAHLARVIGTLAAINDALRGGRWLDLSRLTENPHALADESARLRARREELRSELRPARTLREALAVLPGSETLETLRAELRLQAEQARALTRLNVHAAGRMLAFLERFFLELAGGQPDHRAYGPAGTLQPPSCGSLIEARG